MKVEHKNTPLVRIPIFTVLSMCIGGVFYLQVPVAAEVSRVVRKTKRLLRARHASPDAGAPVAQWQPVRRVARERLT